MFAGAQALSGLSGIATLAVIIFGMISGLHIDPRIFTTGNTRSFWGVSVASVAAPMALGWLQAGLWILKRYPNELLPGVTQPEFIGAIAICVSMKALPVLGAILGEMNLLGRRIGHLALGVAGVNDAALWIVLAVLLGAASAGHAGTGHGVPLLYLLILAPIYLAVMVWLVRPALGRLVTDRLLNGGISTRGRDRSR